MSLLRHEKENQFDRYVNKILDNIYGGNILYYKQAEEEAKNLLKIRKNINEFVSQTSLLSKEIKTPYNKYMHIDLKKQIVSTLLTEATDAILGYNLEFLRTRRFFPMSLNEFIDKIINKDKKKIDYKDFDKSKEAKRVFEYVKERVINSYFVLNNIMIDRNRGVIEYVTSSRDYDYGNVIQYITIKVPNDLDVNVKFSGLKDKPSKLIKDYESLFTYFTLFGFSEIYARCTCPNFVRKHSRKYGVANYFCNHILYSMMQLPYYIMNALY